MRMLLLVLLFYSLLHFMLLLLKNRHHFLILLIILLLPLLLLLINIVIGITISGLLLRVFDRNIHRQVRVVGSRRRTAVRDIGTRTKHGRFHVRNGKCFGGFDCG